MIVVHEKNCKRLLIPFSTLSLPAFLPDFLLNCHTVRMTIENQKEGKKERRGKWSGKKGRFSGVCLLQGKERRPA